MYEKHKFFKENRNLIQTYFFNFLNSLDNLSFMGKLLKMQGSEIKVFRIFYVSVLGTEQ